MGEVPKVPAAVLEVVAAVLLVNNLLLFPLVLVRHKPRRHLPSQYDHRRHRASKNAYSASKTITTPSSQHITMREIGINARTPGVQKAPLPCGI